MPNYTYEIPSSLLTGFTLKQQTELRKIFNEAVETAIENSSGGTALKYYEEDGTSPSSGTLLSGNDVTSSVSSADSDLVNSTFSVLVAGTANVIDAGISSVVAGGSSNQIEASLNSAILGGSGNDVVAGANGVAVVASASSGINGSDSSIVAASSSSSVSGGGNSAVIASDECTVVSSASSAIVGGYQSTATTNRNLTTGQDAINHRQWSFVVGGGASTAPTMDMCQASVLSGGGSSISASPVDMYFGNQAEIAMLPDTVIGIDLLVTACRVSDRACYLFIVNGVAKRIGSAAPVIVAMNVIDSDGDVALSSTNVQMVAGTTGVAVRLTGLAATTISWSGTATLTEQRISA